MQAKDLLLGIYNHFAPCDEEEKAKVNQGINSHWNNLVTDPNDKLYKKDGIDGVVTVVKEYTQSHYIRLFIGLIYLPIFRAVVNFMNPKEDDDAEDGKKRYRD